VLITSITGVATRGDLLDRTISITLPAMSPQQRRNESDLWAQFDRAVPGILGALLNGVSEALRNRNQTQLARLPRLADFATWVEAAAPALGWKPGEFVAAFEAIRQDQDEVALESEAIGPAILALMMEREVWSGTATELLAALNTLALDEVRKDRTWPRNPIQLGRQLERLVPNLRRLGIVVDKKRGGPSGARRTTLTRSSLDTSRQTRQSRQSPDGDGLADWAEDPDGADWETNVA
jgi:putative DNA primase/helicase